MRMKPCDWNSIPPAPPDTRSAMGEFAASINVRIEFPRGRFPQRRKSRSCRASSSRGRIDGVGDPWLYRAGDVLAHVMQVEEIIARATERRVDQQVEKSAAWP